MLQKIANSNTGQRVISFVLMLVAVLGLTTGLAPAKADAAWSSCPSGNVCFWVDTNGNGAMGWTDGRPYGDCRRFTSTFVDKVSSVRNRLPRNVVFWTSNVCLGYWYTVSPGKQINFTSWPHANNFESLEVE